MRQKYLPTWEDIADRPLKTFRPICYLRLSWNGLTVTLQSDKEVTLPDVFYEGYGHFITSQFPVDDEQEVVSAT